jgi:putative flippase GtrA
MSDHRRSRPSSTRHYIGFVAAGLAALAVDALILLVMTETMAISPYLARIVSISIAMVVSWQINRRITFAVQSPPTLAEFSKFATVSWLAQAVNYAVFAAILLLRPETWPVAALVAASLVAMFVSYAGFRFGVFGKA